jgi:hypothetical protein
MYKVWYCSVFLSSLLIARAFPNDNDIFSLHQSSSSMCVWLSTNIRDRLIDAVDCIGFLVWNLNAEFLFDGHNDFHRIEAIQSQVVPEMCRWSNL